MKEFYPHDDRRLPTVQTDSGAQTNLYGLYRIRKYINIFFFFIEFGRQHFAVSAKAFLFFFRTSDRGSKQNLFCRIVDEHLPRRLFPWRFFFTLYCYYWVFFFRSFNFNKKKLSNCLRESAVNVDGNDIFVLNPVSSPSEKIRKTNAFSRQRRHVYRTLVIILKNTILARPCV